MQKVKVVKKKVSKSGDDKHIAEVFGQMVGTTNPNVSIAYPKYENHKKNIRTLLKTLGIFYESLAKMFDAENKEVLMIPQFDVEQDLTANERMSLLMQRRQRDRDTVASQVTKDANYYKYFYGDEFEQQEKRVWWGEANGGDG